MALDHATEPVALRDHPGHFIGPDGQVYKKLSSGELRPLRMRLTPKGRVFVRIYDEAGRRHCVGVKKLLVNAYVD